MRKIDSRFLRLDLHWSSLVRQWTDEACPIYQHHLQAQRIKEKDIPIPILLDGYRNLGLDDGIDTSDLISNLPGAFKQQRVLD
jgi:hypothetical protein